MLSSIQWYYLHHLCTKTTSLYHIHILLLLQLLLYYYYYYYYYYYLQVNKACNLLTKRSNTEGQFFHLKLIFN